MNKSKIQIALILVSLGSMNVLLAQMNYFKGVKYIPEPVPLFATTKHNLPQPIFDEDPSYIKCYWKAWELAFDHFRQPGPESPFVSNYIDEAYNEGLFLWDTSFMTMFCNYGHPYIPGIQSNDNFYFSQLDDGEIVREVSEITGEPRSEWSEPGTPDSLNHPILAWAECESYKITNDKKRLAQVFDPLVNYFHSYEKIKDANSGFYKTSWASMDNSPRNDELLCGIDTNAEVVLFARNLSYMASELGKKREAQNFNAIADDMSSRINARLWDSNTGFYYDLGKNNQREEIETIAAYWTLLAEVASPDQAKSLVEHLTDVNKFKRTHLVPTVAADEPGYNSETGEYWKGAIWAPTNTMVIRGLENYQYNELAYEVAMNHLDNVVKVFNETGTIWENYAPDSVAPGKPARADFVGWSGLGPIAYLIEYAIGIKANAQKNMINWEIKSPDRVGVEKFWFAGNTVNLICDKPDSNGTRKLQLSSDNPIVINIKYNGKSKKFKIPANKTIIKSL